MSNLSSEEQYGADTVAIGVSASIAGNGMMPRATGTTSAWTNCETTEREEMKAKNLPTLATANDVREVVQYLKQRPDGVNICDVVQPIKKRIFYPPKVAAYEFWGLVTRTGERLKLTPLGWDFARSLEPEAQAYRMLLDNAMLYIAALRWIQDQRLDLVNKDDLESFWQSHFPELFADTEPKEVGGIVVSFFHLCQAAELGTMTIGKRGQPARLRIWRDALLQHLQSDSGGEPHARAWGEKLKAQMQ